MLGIRADSLNELASHEPGEVRAFEAWHGGLALGAVEERGAATRLLHPTPKDLLKTLIPQKS